MELHEILRVNDKHSVVELVKDASLEIIARYDVDGNDTIPEEYNNYDVLRIKVVRNALRVYI